MTPDQIFRAIREDAWKPYTRPPPAIAFGQPHRPIGALRRARDRRRRIIVWHWYYPRRRRG